MPAEVFGRRRGIPALELDGLPGAGQGAHGQHAGPGIRHQEVADQEIAAAQFLAVFGTGKPDKDIAHHPPLLLPAQSVEGIHQHLVSRLIGDGMNVIPVRLGDRPGLTDRSATLGDHGLQGHVPTQADHHGALGVHIAVQINVGFLLLPVPRGEAAHAGLPGIGGIPLGHPTFTVPAKGIGQSQPAVTGGGRHSGQAMPRR